MRYIFILFILLLTGCASNAPTNVRGGAEQSPEDCHLWCHNGWCSKHCDPIVRE